jgi:hypothetical protein
MGYSAPTTITTSQLVTAALMNADWVGNIAFLANPPACRVYHNASQALTTAVEFTLAFNSERFDTNSMHDTVTNNSRITFNTAGIYVVTAQVSFANNATGYRHIAIYANNTTYLALQNATAMNGDNHYLVVTTTYKFAVADYVQAKVLQTSGGNLNATVNTNFSPEFSAVWVGLG